jgi:hypothetical protein
MSQLFLRSPKYDASFKLYVKLVWWVELVRKCYGNFWTGRNSPEKVYLAKNLKLFIRESLSREILLISQFAKVYPVNSEKTNFSQFSVSLNPLFQIKYLKEFQKFLYSRKFISRNIINIFIRESLSHEIFCIPQFAKVYPKSFASFSPRESFSRESFSD